MFTECDDCRRTLYRYIKFVPVHPGLVFWTKSAKLVLADDDVPVCCFRDRAGLCVTGSAPTACMCCNNGRCQCRSSCIDSPLIFLPRCRLRGFPPTASRCLRLLCAGGAGVKDAHGQITGMQGRSFREETRRSPGQFALGHDSQQYLSSPRPRLPGPCGRSGRMLSTSDAKSDRTQGAGTSFGKGASYLAGEVELPVAGNWREAGQVRQSLHQNEQLLLRRRRAHLHAMQTASTTSLTDCAGGV